MRRTVSVAAASVMVAAVVAAVQAPTSSQALSVNQVTQMPATGKVVISGRGYGHGHGMSQYGAQGAATGSATGKALDWPDIVEFYYPGTAWGTSPKWIRVRISAATSRDLVVRNRTGLTVKDMKTLETWPVPSNGAKYWRLGVAGTRTVVDYQIDGVWKRWRSLVGDGAFRADGQPMLLNHPGGPSYFRGTLIAASPAPGSSERKTVNKLAIDNYLKGVVPREMPASWHPNALRAQAVAARTYATYEIRHNRHGYYDTCDTSACQVYGGYDAEYAASNAAVTATARRIITYDGGPAFTQFSSSSGGWTSSNQFSYLPSKEDPYDGYTGNANHSWSVTVDVGSIEHAYPAVGDLKSVEFISREGGGQWQGRVYGMVLRGVKAGRATAVRTDGDTFRSRMGLKSTWFTVNPA